MSSSTSYADSAGNVNRGYQFSSGEINLNDIGNNLGVARDMGSFNGRVFYNSSGTAYTILSSPGNTFSLSQLRGYYSSLPGVTFGNYEYIGSGSTTYDGGVGIRAYSKIRNIGATYNGSVMTSITFSVDFYSTNNSTWINNGAVLGTTVLVNNNVVGYGGGTYTIGVNSSRVNIVAYCTADAPFSYEGAPFQSANTGNTGTAYTQVSVTV